MKHLKMITTMILSLACYITQAQIEIPRGFTKGSIVLADGSNLTGYLKDDISRNASITFLNGTNNKKKGATIQLS